jgi:streptogramin lyase
VIGSPIAVGSAPTGVAVTPDGRRVYVANFGSYNVSVIDCCHWSAQDCRRPPLLHKGRQCFLRLLQGRHGGFDQTAGIAVCSIPFARDRPSRMTVARDTFSALAIADLD